MPSEGDLLSGLRDVIYPPEPSWWPPAIGWWLMLALVLALTAVSYQLLKILRQRSKTVKLMRRMESINLLDPHEASAQLSILMRRIAITRYPRETVAGLTGYAWLEFLDRSGDTDQFTKGPGKWLVSAPYSNNDGFEVESLVQVCQNWMKKAMKEAH